MNQVVVGLGSNIHPDENITKARALLARRYRILKESSFISTKPIGNTQQPDFVNGAILLETEFSEVDLKLELRHLEESLGRNRKVDKFAPRTIDLDIVIWNGRVVDQDFYKRDYLKKVVLQIVPELDLICP